MTTFGELKCEVCGIAGSVVAMHRANPKGETGRWRCEPCLGKPVDPGVLAVTDWFETDNMERRADGTSLSQDAQAAQVDVELTTTDVTEGMRRAWRDVLGEHLEPAHDDVEWLSRVMGHARDVLADRLNHGTSPDAQEPT